MSAVTQERKTILHEVLIAARQTMIYGLGSVMAKLLGFLMLPFYTHYLTPSDYGVVEILDLSMSLLAMVLHMGLAPALLRAYAKAETQQAKRSAVSTAFMFVLASGAAVFLAGLPFVGPVSAMLVGSAVPSTYLLLSFSSFVLSYIASLPRTYLRALDSAGTFTTVETVSLFAMLGLNILFIGIMKLGLVGILLSSLIVGVAQTLLLSAWVLRAVGIHFDRRQLKNMTDFGLPLILSNIAVFTLNFSDRFFLQHLRSIELVGIYAVGYKFAFMINYLLVQPFYVMWQSRMYAIHSQGEHRNIFGQMFMLYSLLLIYAALGLALLSPEIVRGMVGEQFLSTQEVIPIVALAYVFYGMGFFVQAGMFLAERTKLIGAISAGVAVVNLALNYVLVGRYGMVGAAWATLLSFALIAAASYICSQRLIHLPYDTRRVALVMGAACAIYAVCRWWDPAAGAPSLAVKGLILAAFPVFVWKAKLLSSAEMDTIVSARQKTVAAVSRVFVWRAADGL